MTSDRASFPFRRVARRLALMAMLGALASGCGVDPGVTAVGAVASPDTAIQVAPTSEPVDEVPAPTTPATEPAPTTTPQPTTTPPDATTPPPAADDTVLLADVALADVVDVGDSKPAQPFDAFVAVAATDIERWWSEQYPTVYGKPFEPLSGGIYAGYPGRESALPGCGEPETAYVDLQLFAAFYCQFDDTMIYDDGVDGDSILAPLAIEYGPAVMGVVLAHEYGHAIQARIDVLDDFIATIYTEQQADCFAGAWVGQAYRGESPLLRLSDADVRTSLLAMLSVRDPVGTNQFVSGGHGSAFDRVGAFQEGFVSGAARCSELLDNPLPLMPNEFQLQSDFETGGNASYDCSDVIDPTNCTPATEFLADDLNDFWSVTLGASFPVLTVEPVRNVGTVTCSDPVKPDDDVLLCPSTSTVAYDEPDILDLYQFGDFTLGYQYGIAWAEQALITSGSTLTGESRALARDCYTGAWVRDITPDDQGQTPRATDEDGDGFKENGIRSSPGDLDEAIQTAILIGDPTAGTNKIGSSFEKITAFRVGVLGGLDACRSQLGV